jgi:ketosteroid isomerase-like protein
VRNTPRCALRDTRRAMSQVALIASKGAPERDVLDRLFVRVPALAGFAAGGVMLAKPGSALRRRLISLLLRRAFATMARSDVDVLVLSYEPDAEVWMRSMSGVGISDCYRGHAGIRALYTDLDEAFEDWRWTIRAIVDGGDRVAVRADFVGHGRGSGAETAVVSGGTAVKLSDRGLAAWQEWFAEQDGWTKALEAVGLSE